MFKYLASFFTGQISVQLIQLISGFLLIRFLTLEEYAQYGAYLAFQMVFVMLVEMGISQSIIPLVGTRITDKQLIAGYIQAALRIRRLTFFIFLGPAVVLFPIFVSKHNWGSEIIILFIISLVPMLYFSGWKTIYQTYYLINRDITFIYFAQFTSEISRLIIIILFYVQGILTPWIAAYIGLGALIIEGSILVITCNKKTPHVALDSSKHELEIKNYMKPLIPGILFSTVQTQITVIIATLFGKTENIAEVAALGRIAQIFVVLHAFNNKIIGPYIASREKGDVLGKYIMIMIPATLMTISLYYIGSQFPEPFLYVLGDSYAHLKDELGLMLLNASLLYVLALMWTVQASRKWIWWWMPLIGIPGTIIVQVVCAIFLDLSTTTNVILFSIYTSIFGLIFRIAMSICGFMLVEKKV